MAKVNVSIPENVLQELDQAARGTGSSRSALLCTAVRRYLDELEQERQKAVRRQAAETIRKIAGEIGPWNGVSEILKWRDAH